MANMVHVHTCITVYLQESWGAGQVLVTFETVDQFSRTSFWSQSAEIETNHPHEIPLP